MKTQTEQINEAVNQVVDLNLQIKEWKKAIAANPTGYFEEIMAADLPALEEKARLANNKAQAMRDEAGLEYNDASETWEPRNATLIVHQSYPVSQPVNGVRSWRIAFLCPTRGIVEIFRDVRVVDDEFEQAALVREQIAAFHNS